MVGRRQRQPRRRSGRRAGDAAAAGGRLLGAGQRRHDRHPAPRAQTSRTPTAPCCSRSTRRRRGTSNIDPFYRQTILDGLRDAASDPGGTSDDVMGNFPEQVYGKTGTAQYQRPARLRLVRLLRPASRPAGRSRSSSTSSAAASATSRPLRSRARSCRSGSSASRAPTSRVRRQRYERDRDPDRRGGGSPARRGVGC